VLSCNGRDLGVVPSEAVTVADATLTAPAHQLRRYEMGIGFSLFLFVVGAVLTFALDVNSSSGFSIDTVGIILMVGGLLGLLLSALFWSSFSPWSRRRTVAGGDRVVEERRIEREL
jgi:DMSO/TMAO reductase YedYZ heme-binding membrane subunit